MILRIKFTNKGIKFIDYYTLPPDVIDCINAILDISLLCIEDDEIVIQFDEEMADIIYLLNSKFDLLIKKG